MNTILNDGRAQLVAPLPSGIEQHMLPSDQTDHTLNIQLLDQTQVSTGHLLSDHLPSYRKHLHALRAEGKDRIAAHFGRKAWRDNALDTIDDLELHRLEADGSCKPKR